MADSNTAADPLDAARERVKGYLRDYTASKMAGWTPPEDDDEEDDDDDE
jgi:hypothetical protein